MGIPFERCGKLVVATRGEHLAALDELEARGHANGLEGLRRLAGDQIPESSRTPAVSAGCSSRRPGSSTTARVCRLRQEVETLGGEILLGAR